MAEHLADAVEHERGRQRAQQDVLRSGLVRPFVVAFEGHECIEAEAEQFERNVGREELARRCEEHRGNDREEQDAVKFARVVDPPSHVLDARQDGDDAEYQEEPLEEQRVIVDADHAVVENGVLPPEEGEREGENAEQRQGSGVGQPVLAFGRREEVAHEDENGQHGHERFRQQEGEVVAHLACTRNAS